MRQSQEGGANNQQRAEELLAHVDEVTKHFVLTDESLRRKWAAESDSEERERQKNNFFHAWSILRAITEDRGRAEARVTEAEQALDVDRVENPENPSTALAEESVRAFRPPQRNDRRIPGEQTGKATTGEKAGCAHTIGRRR